MTPPSLTIALFLDGDPAYAQLADAVHDGLSSAGYRAQVVVQAGPSTAAATAASGAGEALAAGRPADVVFVQGPLAHARAWLDGLALPSQAIPVVWLHPAATDEDEFADAYAAGVSECMPVAEASASRLAYAAICACARAEAQYRRLATATPTPSPEQAVEQLREMALTLTTVEQNERERIAQHLHDHFQQLLIAAKMQIGLHERKAKGGSDRLTEASRLLDEAVEASRNLAVELAPPELAQHNLVDALRVRAQRFAEQYGLTIDVQGEPQADSPTREVRSFLYQAASELLLNVVKHAQASRAHVSLTLSSGRDRLVLSVADDGVGCDDSVPGFGLSHIRQRVTLLGGQYAMASQPGAGCRVSLTVPREAKHGTTTRRRRV